MITGVESNLYLLQQAIGYYLEDGIADAEVETDIWFGPPGGCALATDYVGDGYYENETSRYRMIFRLKLNVSGRFMQYKLP